MKSWFMMPIRHRHSDGDGRFERSTVRVLTAALLFVPFSERTLVRMAYPVGS